jgi:glycosyltransferase involved in cell wall biosynthesis
MTSILFISIAFPPKFDSEGLQVAKIFKYLLPKATENNVKIDVVTSKMPTLNMYYDPSLEEVNFGFRQRIELAIFENKYINFLLRKVAPILIDSPDSKHTFFRQWRSVVKKIKNPPSVIYSRAFPNSSSVMALKLKRYYKVPWLMHISDPWADCPISRFKGFIRKINEYYESLCFSEADMISFTSKETINFYTKKYPQCRDKYILTPNVYDPVDVSFDANIISGKKLKITYTGGLAQTRTPDSFLKAIYKLDPIIRKNFDFVFAGHLDKKSKALFDLYKDDSIRHLGSFKSYKDIIALQKQSHVLLLIDFPIEDESLRVFFLSKLLDYMISGRYILGVSNFNSTCYNLINDGLGRCFEFNQAEEISNHLLFLLNQFEKNRDFFIRKNISDEYSAKNVATKIFSHLQTLAKK